MRQFCAILILAGCLFHSSLAAGAVSFSGGSMSSIETVQPHFYAFRNSMVKIIRGYVSQFEGTRREFKSQLAESTVTIESTVEISEYEVVFAYGFFDENQDIWILSYGEHTRVPGKNMHVMRFLQASENVEKWFIFNRDPVKSGYYYEKDLSTGNETELYPLVSRDVKDNPEANLFISNTSFFFPKTKSLDIAESYRSGKSSLAGIAYDGQYLWFSDLSEDKIYKADMLMNIVESFDSFGNYPYGLTFDGAYLWHVELEEKKIYKLDTSWNLIDSFDSPDTNPRCIVSDGTYFWHTDNWAKKIYKLDSGMNAVASFELDYGPLGISSDGEYLWSVDPWNDKIHKLDRSGNIIESFESPDYAPRGLEFDGTYFWHTDGSEGVIYKLKFPGPAEVGDSDTQTFKITNFGESHIQGKTLSFTGPDASEFSIQNDQYTGQTIAPSETCSFDVVFSPESEGPKNVRLEATFINPDTCSIAWNYDFAGRTWKTVPRPEIFTPEELFFSEVGTGYHETRTLTVTNSGSVDLSVNTLLITGTNASEFSIQNDELSGQNLAPEKNATVDIKFSPASAGKKSATLQIGSNDPDTPSRHISLSGTGAIPEPDISVTPESFKDREIYIGASGIQTFTIRNSGTGDLEVGKLSISGTNASEFWLRNDNCSNQTVALSETCTFDMILTPASSGEKQGNLEVPSDDPDTPSISISLNGTALDTPAWMSWILGDVNNSGKIDLSDASLALQSAADGVVTYPVYIEADINGDKEINLKEAVYILRVLCGDFVNDDNDGDGYTPGEGDCNDNDAGVHPGAAEKCGDGIDQDCNRKDCEAVKEGGWGGETREGITMGDSENEVSLLFTVSGQEIKNLVFISNYTGVSRPGPWPISENSGFSISGEASGEKYTLEGVFTDSITCEINFSFGSYTDSVTATPED